MVCRNLAVCAKDLLCGGFDGLVGFEAPPHASRPWRSKEGTLEFWRLQAQYRTLLEIHNAVSTNHTCESLSQALTRALESVVPFDRATLTLYDAAKDVLQVLALQGLSLPQRFGEVGTEIGRQGSPFGWVFDRQRPFLRHDMRRERRFLMEEKLFAAGLRSGIIVPLIARGKTLGTLNMANKAPNRYDEGDALFLQGVTRQLA
jgi:GAF domain-containing protein